MSIPDYHAFFDLSYFAHKDLFLDEQPVWEVIPQIKEYIKTLSLDGVKGEVIGNPVILGDVFIGEGTKIEPGAFIQGPAWIGKNCQIRHGAYLRGNVIAGDGCILGNSSEFKNCILMDNVQVPHFSYVGDSILGSRSHLGAGVILSNLRTDQTKISVRWENELFQTDLRKFGAVLGDDVEVGCHCVLNPGSVIGKKSWIHPGVVWAGACPPESRILNRNIQKASR
ncbi:MAG: UDP-N-acetylglucosamine diphosphorylase [Verrucomicrobiota bacterium]